MMGLDDPFMLFIFPAMLAQPGLDQRTQILRGMLQPGLAGRLLLLWAFRRTSPLLAWIQLLSSLEIVHIKPDGQM